REEALKRINEKKKKMGGLLTDDGAAHLVAKELGLDVFEDIDYKKPILEIKDISLEMRNVTITGRVARIFPTREFTAKDGRKGKMASIILADKSGEIRVVLWGEHVQNIDKGKLKEGQIIRIFYGYIKEGLRGEPELHVGYRGRIEIGPKDVKASDFPKIKTGLVKIGEIKPNMTSVDTVGMVQRLFPTTEFKRQDGGQGKVCSITLVDETGGIRTVFWDDQVEIAENLSEGDVIKIEGGYTRANLRDEPELHVGKLTNVVINPDGVKIDIKVTQQPQGTSQALSVKIKDLQPDMRSVNTGGRVVSVSNAREFTKKDGTSGKMVSFTIADETASVRVVAWGDHAETVSEISEGDIIKLKRAYTRTGLQGEVEVHLGRFSEVELNTNEIEIPDVKTVKPKTTSVARKNICELEKNQIVEVRATLVQFYQKKPVYEVCSKCAKRVEKTNGEWMCKECGVVKPVLRYFFSGVLDDGTSVIRGNFMGDAAQKLLGMSPEEAYDLIKRSSNQIEPLKVKAPEVEGKEIIALGKVVYNEYSKLLELNVYDIREPDTEEESKILLSKLNKNKK
ncbi:MAG: OB-fold nucleic acid binding domain-containing protein, partial [Candidatus Jordarchaeaceae archaeon]